MPDFAAATIVWGGSTITLLDLMKQLLNITDDTQNDELSMWLQMAGEAAEQYIDNKLAKQEVKELFASNRSPVALRYFPASTLTSVDLDGTDQTADWQTYISDGICWAENGVISKSTFEQLTITYDAGFDPLPAEVGYAITQIAVNYEASGGSGSSGIKKEVIQGVGSIEYVTSADTDGNVGLLAPATIGTLEKYRRIHA